MLPSNLSSPRQADVLCLLMDDDGDGYCWRGGRNLRRFFRFFFVFFLLRLPPFVVAVLLSTSFRADGAASGSVAPFTGVEKKKQTKKKKTPAEECRRMIDTFFFCLPFSFFLFLFPPALPSPFISSLWPRTAVRPLFFYSTTSASGRNSVKEKKTR